VEHLPDETSVNEYKLIELSDLFIELENNADELEMALHTRAQNLLAQNDIESAWKTLLAFNN
jgi:hypothetical protein